MMLAFSYFPYCCAEALDLSGITSILFAGIVMSHYAHQNLSLVTQEWTFYCTEAHTSLTLRNRKNYYVIRFFQYKPTKDKRSKCLSCYVLFGRNFSLCLFGNGHFLVSTQVGPFIPYLDHYTDSNWTSSQYFPNFMVPKQFQRNKNNQKNAICYVV